jgi:hypothetical protein
MGLIQPVTEKPLQFSPAEPVADEGSLTNRRRERIEKRKAFRKEMPSVFYQLSQR